MDKSERGKARKHEPPLFYQEQEICQWMGKIYTSTKTQQSKCHSVEDTITSTTHTSAQPYLAAPFPGFFSRWLPSTFVVHVHGCLGALGVEHRVLARSLKRGSMSLPPLLPETSAGQDCVVLVTCGGGSGTEERWGRHKHREKGDLFSLR